ncbi:MAG: 6-pyruvoyl-tetrahydropterin synthase-related protein, partial [Candidatus Methanofastidiosia archaeon]
KYYVVSGEKQIIEFSPYIDDYTIEELLTFDAVLLYNFNWHNLETCQKLLMDYVEDGGKLIIDCSRNFESDSYKLEHIPFPDMRAYRSPLTKNPEIKTFGELSGEYIFSEFLSGGSPWYGATYMPIDGTCEVLATADGTTLVAKKEVGNGTVIWVGYNLFYHAFDKENPSEKEFVKKIFEILLEE